VTIRGIGFVGGSKVYFGDNLADPSTTKIQDETRIICVSPGGDVGPAKVKVVRPEAIDTAIEDGFTYDRFYLDPASGSTAGGTFVRIIGKDTAFGADTTVHLGNQLIEQVKVVSPTVVTGVTPAAPEGSVSARIETGDKTYTVNDAYQYFSGSDPINGGLGGGPIHGELTVHIYDTYTMDPIEGAYVLLGAAPSTPYQGYTDATGGITFSDPYLTGPQMLTAAAPQYERVSFVSFDAKEVTAYLKPYIPPKGSGTFPGTSYSAVTGRVLFGGIEQEGDPCAWDQILPEPGPGKTRVIKIYQTVPSINATSPEPGQDGIIRENAACDNGYSYFIYTRPGSYALYALAGFEDEETNEFTPLASGFARSLVTAPGQILEQDLHIDLVLDQSITVQMTDPPPLDDVTGPALYRVRMFLDLGGDGYVVRKDLAFETQDATTQFTFEHLSGLTGSDAGGSYQVVAEAYNYGTYPFSKMIVTDLSPRNPDPVVLDGFLDIPQATDPAPDGAPSSHRMVWTEQGPSPTMHLVLVRTYPDGDPFWKLYISGDLTQFSLPDLSSADGLPGYPAGTMLWHIYSIEVPGLDFDGFSYRYMSEKYWTASAAATYTFHFQAQ